MESLPYRTQLSPPPFVTRSHSDAAVHGYLFIWIGAGGAVSLASALFGFDAPLPRGAPTPERFRVRFVYTTSAFL